MFIVLTFVSLMSLSPSCSRGAPGLAPLQSLTRAAACRARCPLYTRCSTVAAALKALTVVVARRPCSRRHADCTATAALLLCSTALRVRALRRAASLPRCPLFDCAREVAVVIVTVSSSIVVSAYFYIVVHAKVLGASAAW
jgi:hypothetical protein